jgi:hypothetical protein
MSAEDIATPTPVSVEVHLRSGDYDLAITTSHMLCIEDACHLEKYCLLFPDENGFLKISREVMNSRIYRQPTANFSRSFWKWETLPNELKVMVMEECSDIDLGHLGKRKPYLS